MLQSHPAPFPCVTAHAFLKPDARPVQIVDRKPGDQALIRFLPTEGMSRIEKRQLAGMASGNTTVDLDQLTATADEALGIAVEPTPEPQHKRARRRSRAKVAG